MTGANGFVGQHLLRRLSTVPGLTVRAAVRDARSMTPDVEVARIGNIDESTNWLEALRDVDVVVHLAARVHVMRDGSADPLTEYRRTNVRGTEQLAVQAAAAGCRRFIFISSVKVNGESSAPGRPLRESDTPAPVDPYGVSKSEAEAALFRLSGAPSTTMDVVVIRPPLVYGRGVTANFRALVNAIGRGLPLPLGGVKNNRRSMVSVDNLISLIARCVDHPMAANEVFFASDGDDLSTVQLIERIAVALDVRPRLVSVPPGLLLLCARLLGKREAVQRLVGTLQVDIAKAARLLDWTPDVPMAAALRSVVGSHTRQ